MKYVRVAMPLRAMQALGLEGYEERHIKRGRGWQAILVLAPSHARALVRRMKGQKKYDISRLRIQRALEAAKPKCDPTGLKLVGRCERTQRYRYASLSVFGQSNTVLLTQEERLELARWATLLREHFWGHRLFPLTRRGNTLGYGLRGGRVIWINRNHLRPDDVRNAAGTIAHEIAHNLQPEGSKPHGKEWNKLYIATLVKIKRVTNGLTCFPKFDKRTMRPSMAAKKK